MKQYPPDPNMIASRVTNYALKSEPGHYDTSLNIMYTHDGFQWISMGMFRFEAVKLVKFLMKEFNISRDEV